jgi:hypothetical protein
MSDFAERMERKEKVRELITNERRDEICETLKKDYQQLANFIENYILSKEDQIEQYPTPKQALETKLTFSDPASHGNRVSDNNKGYFEVYGELGKQFENRPELVQCMIILCGSYELSIFHPTEKAEGYDNVLTIANTTNDKEIISFNYQELTLNNLREFREKVKMMNVYLKELGFTSMLDSNFLFTVPE